MFVGIGVLRTRTSEISVVRCFTSGCFGESRQEELLGPEVHSQRCQVAWILKNNSIERDCFDSLCFSFIPVSAHPVHLKICQSIFQVPGYQRPHPTRHGATALLTPLHCGTIWWLQPAGIGFPRQPRRSMARREGQSLLAIPFAPMLKLDLYQSLPKVSLDFRDHFPPYPSY